MSVRDPLLVEIELREARAALLRIQASLEDHLANELKAKDTLRKLEVSKQKSRETIDQQQQRIIQLEVELKAATS